jgi:hypothetical protein
MRSIDLWIGLGRRGWANAIRSPSAAARQEGVARVVLRCALALGLGAGVGLVQAATPYETAAKRGADWLTQQQNAETGSWAPLSQLEFVTTAEATLALQSANARNAAYLRGLAWLQAQNPRNLDHTARRVLVLAVAGNSILADVQSVNAGQSTAAPVTKGWGLSSAYQSAPLDTALALQALDRAGATTTLPTDALNFLKASQLTGTQKGWAVGQEATADAATTAQVLIALCAFKARDATLQTPITNGLSALNAMVVRNSSASLKALAALANLRNNAASTTGKTYLDWLVADQTSVGSWGGSSYSAALAVRALAAGAATDLASEREVVNMPDAALRKAVNDALGRNALDPLNRGEIKKLIVLNAPNSGITDVTGLEWAINLTSGDLSGNAIVSTQPIAQLPGFQAINLAGNPIRAEDGDAPLPPWAIVTLAVALGNTVARRRRKAGKGKSHA